MAEKAKPARFQRIVDRVEEHDADWFLANPGRHLFARETVPGEFGSIQVSEITVVMKIGDTIARVAMQGAIPLGAKEMTIFTASGDEVCMPVVPLSVN